MRTTSICSIFSCTLLFFTLANAQTWISGSHLTDQAGTYNNSLGPLNVLGSRSDQASWVVGNQVWVFGGLGYGNETLLQEVGLLNDLWKWTDVWWYVNGSKIPEEPSQYNPILGPVFPGGRRNVIHWYAYDQLWIFGGSGVEGVLNDVWAYNISSGLWTFKGGSQLPDVPPNYNTSLPPPPEPPLPPSNVTIPPNPGSREGSFTWFANDVLWLFGGLSTEELYHNDIWTYNLHNDSWKWVAGTNGTNSTNNVGSPSGRAFGASWVGADGSLYLFGGYYIDEIFEAITLFNDLWQFNTTTLQWRNIQPSTPGGVYNNTPNAKPAPRYGPAYTSDKRGNLYLFGGRTPLLEESPDTRNDLWIYNISSNTWKWVLGSDLPNSPGVYNLTTRKGVPAARGGGSLWIDSAERLWLFGGSTSEEEFGFRNDLWILIDDVDPTPPTTTGDSTTTGSGFPSTSTGSANDTLTTGAFTTGVPSSTGTTGPFTTGVTTATSNATTSTTGAPVTTTTTSSTGPINTTSSTTSSTSPPTLHPTLPPTSPPTFPPTSPPTSPPATSTTGSTVTTGPINSTSTITSGSSISTGPLPSTGVTTGNATVVPHHVNPGVIVGSVLGGGITIGAGVVGILYWRGNMRVRNLFRRKDTDDDNELLPINAKINH